MSKHPHSNKSDSKTSSNVTHDETAEIVKETVAETVEQLVTTSQVKPETTVVEEVKTLPSYDLEKAKAMNISQTVRYLAGLGFTRGQIVKEFPKIKNRPILYQHVRNVLITPVKAS